MLIRYADSREASADASVVYYRLRNRGGLPVSAVRDYVYRRLFDGSFWQAQVELLRSVHKDWIRVL